MPHMLSLRVTGFPCGFGQGVQQMVKRCNRWTQPFWDCRSSLMKTESFPWRTCTI